MRLKWSQAAIRDETPGYRLSPFGLENVGERGGKVKRKNPSKTRTTKGAVLGPSLETHLAWRSKLDRRTSTDPPTTQDGSSP